VTKLGGGGGKKSVTERELGRTRDDGLADRVLKTGGGGGGVLSSEVGQAGQEEVAEAKVGCYVSQARCQRVSDSE
jgi:hypothetical protein